MSVIDFREHLDDINDLSNMLFSELLKGSVYVRDNLYTMDDFSVDINSPRKHNYRVSIKDRTLRKVIDVIYQKNTIHIKFSTEFIITIPNVHNDCIKTNLFSTEFGIDTIRDTFDSELNIIEKFEFSTEKLRELIVNTILIYTKLNE